MKTSPLLALALVLIPAAARGQSAQDMTPNLAGGWIAAPGTVQFNFVHRFDMGPAPFRKVTNTPTFVVAYGVTSWITAGFTYGSNSDAVALYPNEWEWFGRVAPLRRAAGAPLDLTVQGGYNLAARSLDAAATAQRDVGSLRFTALAGVLGSAFDAGETRLIAGAGASLRLRPSVALTGDVSGLLDARPGEDMAWSAGLSLGIPSTPHSLSLHVSNVGTRTLQGIARGGAVTRVGFEYTVPITIGRYLRRTPSAPAEVVQPDSNGVVEIAMESIAYTRPHIVVPPGTTVRWVNRDPLAHTVTADNGGFDSSLINPSGTYERRFDAPGTYRYHCTPHPFMKGIVVVR